MLCHYNVVDFGTSKSNTINEPIIQSCTFGNTKKSSQKLPKLGLFSQKYTNKAFRTTVSRGGALDERYYKEATKSRKMSSTTRSKFRNSRYDKEKKEKKLVILMKKVMKEAARIKKYLEMIMKIRKMAVIVEAVVAAEKEVN